MATTVDDFRKRLTELIGGVPSKEDKLRALRGYARQNQNIPGAWHYPDDREPCPYCPQNTIRHGPDLGVRGYIGTGPYALVSHVPSGDIHFNSYQAQTYRPILSKYGLSNAFQTDAYNSATWTNREEQQALFQIQIEVVEPSAMLVMDMHSYPRRRSDGWAGIGFLPTIERYLGSGPFSFQVQRQYRPQASIVPAGTVNYLISEARALASACLRFTTTRSSPTIDLAAPRMNAWRNGNRGSRLFCPLSEPSRKFRFKYIIRTVSLNMPFPLRSIVMHRLTTPPTRGNGNSCYLKPELSTWPE
jgi:hypothetical protein